ncbi:hypothetical protein P0D69_43635 [Paraburkholderia sediminicola]|uniref:hypothetical protein n=1 Tax=Paraburkholderia sediminicola TaxID=458836 RepID=UPI0038BBAA1E
MVNRVGLTNGYSFSSMHAGRPSIFSASISATSETKPISARLPSLLDPDNDGLATHVGSIEIPAAGGGSVDQIVFCNRFPGNVANTEIGKRRATRPNRLSDADYIRFLPKMRWGLTIELNLPARDVTRLQIPHPMGAKEATGTEY